MHVSEIMDKCHRTVSISDDPSSILAIMQTEGLDVVPVVGSDGKIAGLLRRSRIIESLAGDSLDEALEETFPASDPISPA